MVHTCLLYEQKLQDFWRDPAGFQTQYIRWRMQRSHGRSPFVPEDFSTYTELGFQYRTKGDI